MLCLCALQREEEAARKRQIEKEFAMMEVRALMDSGLIPSRNRRAGSSRGSIDAGPFDPAGQERARLHAERAAASVVGGGVRHFRRRSTTCETGDPVQPVLPRQRTVSEDGIFLERGRSAENGGIPAAATLAGLQKASPQPSMASSPSRGRAEPSPRASPPTTPSRVPSGTYAPAAAQRQPSPRSPLTFGAGASPRSAGGRMSPLSLSPSQSIESDIGRKAASAWTAALDTMNVGRRTGGGNPRHMGGAGGSSTSLTDSAASGQLDAQSGRSTPDGLLGGQRSEASASAAAAAAAAEEQKAREQKQQRLLQEGGPLVRQLGGEVMRFRGANMAEVAAFVRNMRQQLPADFTESTLRQVCILTRDLNQQAPFVYCRSPLKKTILCLGTGVCSGRSDSSASCTLSSSWQADVGRLTCLIRAHLAVKRSRALTVGVAGSAGWVARGSVGCAAGGSSGVA